MPKTPPPKERKKKDFFDDQNGIWQVLKTSILNIALEHVDDKCHVFTIIMQREAILEHIDAKCHLCTL